MNLRRPGGLRGLGLGVLVSATALGAAAPDPPSGRWGVHAGVTGVMDRDRAGFVSLEAVLPAALGPTQPWLLLGRSGQGAGWIGAGLRWERPLRSRLQWSLGAAITAYDGHHGPDLGHPVEFLTCVELSYRGANERRVVMRLAHLSNARLARHNPGTELFSLGYEIPWR